MIPEARLPEHSRTINQAALPLPPAIAEPASTRSYGHLSSTLLSSTARQTSAIFR